MNRANVLTCLLVMLPFIGETQCIAGDCLNGRGAFRFPDGSRYIGQFQDGEIHGWGSLLHNNGHRYRGTWVNRLPSGEGIIQLSDGRTWKGEWRYGHPLELEQTDFLDVLASNDWPVQTGCQTGQCDQGEGVNLLSDGSKHKGRFSNGIAHGQGVRQYPNGVRLKGQFRHGLPDGNGTLELEGELELKGDWSEGHFEIRNRNAIGCQSGDCKDGLGLAVLWEGQGIYKGSFLNGQPDGLGVALFSDASHYEGEWKSGRAHGRGNMFQSDGSFYSGIWENGVLKVPVADPGGMVSGTASQQSSSPSAMLSVESGFGESGSFLPKKVWAVIVGVAEYHHMPPLRYTDDDAYRIYAFLKSPEGGALDDANIRILIDEDATKKAILGAMLEVFGQAGPQDLVLLYFSGHGLEGSFLPFDFDGNRNQLLHREINDILSSSEAGFKLCIADACHSGSLVSMKGGNMPQALAADSGRPPTESGNAMLLSSRSNEISLESSGLRQGVFTHYLIRGWKGEADQNADLSVSLQELYDYLYDEVRRYTNHRQSPIITGHFLEDLIISIIR